MNLFSWHKWSLTVSLSVTMTLLVIAAVTGVTLLSIDREAANFREELQGQAEVVMVILENGILNPLLNLDTDFLADEMEAFGETGVAVGGGIYDTRGRLIVDETGSPSLQSDCRSAGRRTDRQRRHDFPMD